MTHGLSNSSRHKQKIKKSQQNHYGKRSVPQKRFATTQE